MIGSGVQWRNHISVRDDFNAITYPCQRFSLAGRQRLLPMASYDAAATFYSTRAIKCNASSVYLVFKLRSTCSTPWWAHIIVSTALCITYTSILETEALLLWTWVPIVGTGQCIRTRTSTWKDKVVYPNSIHLARMTYFINGCPKHLYSDSILIIL